MFNWAKGFGWKKNSKLKGRASQLDALGAAVKLLSFYGKKLTLENLEVLLAIGSLVGPGGWVNLREIKAKLPDLSSHQLSRSLSALSAGGSMIESLFTTKEPLIKSRVYEQSHREKEVSLTEYGILILNRSIQTITTGFTNNQMTRMGSPRSGLFKLMVRGETPNRKKVQFETKRLLSIGHVGTGVVESSHSFAGQAIAQGATLYWLGLTGSSRTASWLYTLALMHSRDHHYYVNGDVRNAVAIQPIDVFDNQGICYHVIDKFVDSQENHEQRLVESLSEIADAVELQENLAGVFIVIEACAILRHYSTGAEQIKRIMEAGAVIHIIDSQFGSDNDDEVISAMKALGFDIADYRFEKTGVEREGYALFQSQETTEILLQMDYVDLPLHKTFDAVNVVKRESTVALS